MFINNGTNGLQRSSRLPSPWICSFSTLTNNWNPYPHTIRVHGISCTSYRAISRRPDSLNKLQPCPLCHQNSANLFGLFDNVSPVKGKAHRSLHLSGTHRERPMRVLTILSRSLIVADRSTHLHTPSSVMFLSHVYGSDLSKSTVTIPAHDHRFLVLDYDPTSKHTDTVAH